MKKTHTHTKGYRKSFKQENIEKTDSKILDIRNVLQNGHGMKHIT